jgi:hypothetical protein
MGDPYTLSYRITAGWAVRANAVFQDEEDTWIALTDDCWVPTTALEASADGPNPLATAGDAGEADDLPRVIHVEIDTPWEDAFAPGFIALRDKGMLAEFEPSERVVGLALSLDSLDRAAVGMLLDAAGEASHRTLDRLRGLIYELQERYEDDPVLGPLSEALLDKDLLDEE